MASARSSCVLLPFAHELLRDCGVDCLQRGLVERRFARRAADHRGLGWLGGTIGVFGVVAVGHGLDSTSET